MENLLDFKKGGSFFPFNLIISSQYTASDNFTGKPTCINNHKTECFLSYSDF